MRRGLRLLAMAGFALTMTITVTAPVAVAASFNEWSPAASLGAALQGQATALMHNGEVLIAGGTTDGSTCLTTARVYNPATNVYSTVASMTTARCQASAVALTNGDVLVAGGQPTWSGGSSLDSGEVYAPATNHWTAVTNTMSDEHGFQPVIALLPSGKALVAGGQGSSAPTTAASLYDPATNSFSTTGSMIDASDQPIFVSLSTGQVLVAGGSNGSAALQTGEVYSPASGTWRATANEMAVGRAFAGGAPLSGGEALVVGGFAANFAFGTGVNSSDVYNAATNRFSPGPALTVARGAFGIASLADGRVLIAGGSENYSSSTSQTDTPTSELYSPATNSWQVVGDMPGTGADSMTMNLLPSGQVLALGGEDNSFAPVDQTALFTPSTKPGAPASVVASAGNGAAMVSFTPPASDGGEPVLHYTVTASTGTSITTPDTRSVVTFGGLPNGRPVRFTVTATNISGAGPASAASTAVTPEPAPSVRITGLAAKLKVASFLTGVKFALTPNQPLSLQVSLLATTKQATIASAYDLTLATKTLGLGSNKRSVKLVPNKRLVGSPRHATVELVIVATNAAGARSTTTRKLKIRG
jgi:hypothetical protein